MEKVCKVGHSQLVLIINCVVVVLVTMGGLGEVCMVQVSLARLRATLVLGNTLVLLAALVGTLAWHRL